MSIGAVKACAFGDLDAGIWGVVWASESGEAAVHVGSISAGTALSGSPGLEGDGLEQEWRVSGEGIELTLSGTGAAGPLALPDYQLVEQVQLCRVEGQALLDGEAVPLRCCGQRSLQSLPAAGQVDSLRELCGWFGGEEGVAVLVARPSGNNGHDRDAVSAVLFEGGQPSGVAEPRVSSVYDAAGTPVRAGLELWFEEPDEAQEEGDGAPPPQFPCRLAGEALGSTAVLQAGSLELRAELFRWHLRGEQGAGVYLLAALR